MEEPTRRRVIPAILLALAAFGLAVGLALRPVTPPRPQRSSPSTPAPSDAARPAELPVRPGAATSPSEAPTTELRVYVTDEARTPLVGARVRLVATEPLLELEAFTDEAGEALLEAPRAGDVELSAEAAGFAALRRVVRLPASGPIRLALDRVASLDVLVVDTAGRPLEGVEIAFRPGERRARREETTGADGRARLDELPPGGGQLEARPEEQRASSQWLTLAPGERRAVTIELQAGAAVGGRVLDPLGRPVAGAFVEARSPAPPNAALASGRSDPDGRFRLAGLTPGAIVLEAEADGFGRATATLEAPGEATLTLAAAAALFGELRGPDGAIPTRGAANGHPLEAGRFLVDGLQPGPIELTLSADGLAPRSLALTLAPGEVRDLGVVTLEAGRVVTLRAVDAQGRPVLAELELRSDALGVALSDRADERGARDFRELPSGRYLASARAEGVGRARGVIELGATDVELVLTLAAGARVHGEVIGPDGEPLSTGHVALLGRDRGVEHGASEIDSTGRFWIEDVPQGPAIALIEAPDGSHLLPVEVPQTGLTLRIDLRPKEGATVDVEVQLLDAAGHPVERGAALLLPGVRTVPTDGPALLAALATPQARPFEWRTSDGRLRLARVAPGGYTLLLLLDGRAHDVGLLWSEPLVVPEAGPLRRVVRLPADLPSLDLETLRGSAP